MKKSSINVSRGSAECFSRSYDTPVEELIKIICTQLINLGVMGLGTPCLHVVACEIIHMCVFIGRGSIASTRLLLFLNMKSSSLKTLKENGEHVSVSYA